MDGGHQDYSAAVLAEIDRLGQGKPVTALFNTNWRPEHCGLNEHFGSLGTRIIAHENTRLWQNNDFYVSWEDRHYRPMAPTAQANSTFYKQDSLTFAGSSVDYGFISQFHTDGDIYVYFRESNVLVLGDMLTVNAYPLLDYVSGGWIGGAQQTTAGLLQLTDAQTLTRSRRWRDTATSRLLKSSSKCLTWPMKKSLMPTEPAEVSTSSWRPRQCPNTMASMVTPVCLCSCYTAAPGITCRDGRFRALSDCRAND